MSTRSVLWADLRTDRRDPDLCASLPKSYGAQRVTNASDILRALQSGLPWAACFEFDLPDPRGLSVLTETRKRYRSLPLIVVTGQHSEELAAWALHWYVWDYLVKPLSLRRMCNCLTNIDKAVPPTTPEQAVSPKLSVNAPVTASPLGPSVGRTLAPAVSYVEANFSEKLRLATAARLCHLSPFQFSRNFKRERGVTFRDFVIRVRIQRAADLMRESRVSVTEAAFGVGFNDLSYFARMFRRQLGVSPSDYRVKSEPRQLPLFPNSN